MAVDPAERGPYDALNGRCLFGHKVNGFGRCEPANTNGCPAEGEDPWDPATDPDGRD